MRSFPEVSTGSSCLMEEICSMGSVRQGRGPRGAVQFLSWDVLRIQRDRIPSFEQEVGLKSLWRALPLLSILG